MLHSLRNRGLPTGMRIPGSGSAKKNPTPTLIRNAEKNIYVKNIIVHEMMKTFHFLCLVHRLIYGKVKEFRLIYRLEMRSLNFKIIISSYLTIYKTLYPVFGTNHEEMMSGIYVHLYIRDKCPRSLDPF